MEKVRAAQSLIRHIVRRKRQIRAMLAIEGERPLTAAVQRNDCQRRRALRVGQHSRHIHTVCAEAFAELRPESIRPDAPDERGGSPQFRGGNHQICRSAAGIRGIFRHAGCGKPSLRQINQRFADGSDIEHGQHPPKVDLLALYRGKGELTRFCHANLAKKCADFA